MQLKLGSTLGPIRFEQATKRRYKTQNRPKRTNHIALVVLPWAQGVRGSNPRAPTIQQLTYFVPLQNQPALEGTGLSSLSSSSEDVSTSATPAHAQSNGTESPSQGIVGEESPSRSKRVATGESRPLLRVSSGNAHSGPQPRSPRPRAHVAIAHYR
jgi:hypothetical protein